MNAVTETKDYAIADLALADWGRKEIRIAETEMPGLMAIRAEYGGNLQLDQLLQAMAHQLGDQFPGAAAIE